MKIVLMKFSEALMAGKSETVIGRGQDLQDSTGLKKNQSGSLSFPSSSLGTH
jgi:hypothetical protein